MKRVLSLVLTLCLLACALPLSASAANLDASGALSLSYDDFAEGDLQTGETAVYRFVAQRKSVRVAAAADSDCRIQVYNDRGELHFPASRLAWEEDEGFYSGYTDMVNIFTPGKTYYLAITAEKPGGEYTMMISDKAFQTAADRFTDVSPAAYYYDAIAWAVENGVTSGTDATRFSPTQKCTRAQAVTFLWNAAGKPEPTGTADFSDVPANAWYAKAVAWAVENSITSGVGDGKFGPGVICDRAQIVTFMWNAAKKPAADGSSFTDVKSGSWYDQAVSWAVSNEITSGVGGGRFGPAIACDRAQIVTFLYNAAAK